MVIIANRRADAARTPYIEDARARKLTIARGRGSVHGRYYDPAVDYALELETVQALDPHVA